MLMSKGLQKREPDAEHSSGGSRNAPRRVAGRGAFRDPVQCTVQYYGDLNMRLQSYSLT